MTSELQPGACRAPAAPVDVSALVPGTHLISLYQNDAELTQVAAVFVGAGLAAGDRVLYVAGDRPATAALASLHANLAAAPAVAAGLPPDARITLTGASPQLQRLIEIGGRRNSQLTIRADRLMSSRRRLKRTCQVPVTARPPPDRRPDRTGQLSRRQGLCDEDGPGPQPGGPLPRSRLLQL